MNGVEVGALVDTGGYGLGVVVMREVEDLWWVLTDCYKEPRMLAEKRLTVLESREEVFGRLLEGYKDDYGLC